MQPIKKDELFRHLADFLKSKGVELTNGSLTAPIQEGCNLLSDTINATHKTVEDTRAQMDEALDRLRQSIHEHTAPPKPTSPAAESSGPAQPPKANGKPQKRSRAKRPSPAAKRRRTT